MGWFSGSDLLLVALGLATAAATLLGGSLALRFEKQVHLILGFSAGAVIGVALFDLLPEAVSLGQGAAGPTDVVAMVAAGFLGYLVLDRSLRLATGGESGPRGHLAAGSLTVHSFLDGLGIGLGFQVSSAVGVVLAMAVLAHDFADGINTVNLSLAGSGRPGLARRWLLANAMAPMLGIGVSRLIAVPPAQLGLLIATFAGFFLYIGAAELLPESHRRHPHPWTTMSTLLGAALILLVSRASQGQ